MNSNPKISKIYSDIIKEILRLKYLHYCGDSRENESIDASLLTCDLSRSNVPYTIKEQGASIVCVDKRNKNYRHKGLKLKKEKSVVPGILEHSDWRTSLTFILTLCYQGEAVNVFNSLNCVTISDSCSRVGTFAVEMFNSPNESINYEKPYAGNPHRLFCQGRSFLASLR